YGFHLRDAADIADLDGVDRAVFQCRAHLLDQQRRRRTLPVLVLLGVAHIQRGDRGKTVAAKTGCGFDIGDDAGTATRIVTVDGQKRRVAVAVVHPDFPVFNTTWDEAGLCTFHRRKKTDGGGDFKTVSVSPESPRRTSPARAAR